jgi:hypothetical protein
MQTPGLYDTTFLASNDAPPENGFFQGYCFIGNDLIFGTNGAQHYQALTGNPIPAAQDGCYVTVQQHNDAYVFDVDFAGYTILYYYHNGTTWAVSNSFSQIVDHLRHHNIPVRPNYAHLAATNGKGMALGQLFSLQTLVHGIQVAPRTHSLIVTPHKVVLQRRPSTNSKHSTYPQALSEYLNTWVARFETLMHSPDTDFTVDLTGGVDSRTNFALVQAATTRLKGSGTTPRLRCASSTNNRKDLEIATTIAKHYGMEVNDNRDMRRIPLQGQESYQVYRNLTMGVYYPFYRPSQAPTPTNITIGGGGGGIHRKTYELIIKSDDPEMFFRQYANNIKRPEYETEFIRDGHQFLHTVLQPGEDPLRVLLRDGRVRYHSGRTPRTEVAFTPLHSVTAEHTQLLAGETRVEEGQLNYDIMHSLKPDLVTMPYDEESKHPTPDILGRLTRAPIHTDAAPGKVWAPTAHLISQPAQGQPRPIEAYKQAFDQAIDNPFVRKFWGKAMIRQARDLMQKLDAEKSIGNAANGIPISAVFSADLVTPS